MQKNKPNPAPEEEPKVISSGWRMKDLTPEQLQSAPDDVVEIYLIMKAGQPVDSKLLVKAIETHGGKYFIAPKQRYQKQSKGKSFSDGVRKIFKG